MHKNYIYNFIILSFVTLIIGCTRNSSIKKIFSSPDAAFDYFIDTTGLVKDTTKIDEFDFSPNFTKQNKEIGEKVKFITNIVYDLHYTSKKKLEKILNYIKVKTYDLDGLLEYEYIKSYNDNDITKYTYNSRKQLIKSELIGKRNVYEYVDKINIKNTKTYTYLNQDSVKISETYNSNSKTEEYPAYKKTGTYSLNSLPSYKSEINEIKLKPIDLKYSELLKWQSERIRIYERKYVTYY